jgi:hypothetical protein
MRLLSKQHGYVFKQMSNLPFHEADVSTAYFNRSCEAPQNSPRRRKGRADNKAVMERSSDPALPMMKEVAQLVS